MDAQRWTVVVATFDELVELEPVALERRLSAIATADPELRRNVEELLAADAQAEDRLARIDQALTPSRSARREDMHDADPLNLVGQTVSHFRVIELVAYGGMGVVYRAEDTQLRRAIALKFPLPTHHFDRSARERFLREARVAAALDHPNLCPIHEVGETDDGQLFYAMPLYVGETLKERLGREGALRVADAFHIARQIATGLSAAHKAGIVHRDLKPANVMLLRDGTVRILDFGLAKGSDLSVTDPATTLGTVSYMAPEQVQGHEVDVRADLWALGVVLHEMLTGQRPFRGEQAITVAHAIVHNDPEHPSALRAGITGSADALVETLLRKDPAQRYASADKVTASLDAISLDPGRQISLGSDGARLMRARRLTAFAARIRFSIARTRRGSRVALGVGVFAILLVGFAVSRALGIGPAASLFATGKLSPSDSLVVADFVVQGADPSLGSTMAEWVRTDLKQSNVVTIVSDGTIRGALERMRRPDGTRLVSDIARELAQREGFAAVVEGEFQALGNGYLITVRLVSAEGDQLASFPGTASLDELLPTVGQLTRRLRRRIGESLKHVRGSPPLPQVTSHSIAALRKYAEGTRALSENNHILAAQLLNEAVALDSTFAMAWVVLSAAYRNGDYPPDRSHHALERAYHNRERLPERERYHTEGMYFRVGPSRDRARAAQAYEKGLQLDTAAFANNLGLLHLSRREYARAESLFRWYCDRGRNSQVAYENLANALYFQGRREEAESVEAETSRRFDNPERWARAAWYLYNRGQLDSAQHSLERLQAEGDATLRRFAWSQLSALHLVRGRLGDAERARDQAGETNLARSVSRDSVAEKLWRASLDVWHRNQRERGFARLERVLAQTPLNSLPLVSPLQSEPYYLWVARIFAQAQRPDRARAMLAQFNAANRDTALKRVSEPAVYGVLGEIALAEGRPREALREFRRADRLADGPIQLFALGLHADVGRAFDQAGMADSAIATFELYLETPQLTRFSHDAVYLAHILQRLGALYEAKGDRAKAIEHYERFIQLWRNADPELQPRVAEARRRIELLRVSEKRG